MKEWCKKIFSFWNKSIENKILISLFFFWIIFSIVFGIYDLEISKSIVNKNSSFANFINSFGEFPGLILMLFSSWIISSRIKFKNKIKDFGFFLTSFLISLAITFYLVTIIIYSTNFGIELFNEYSFYYWIIMVFLNISAMYFFRIKFKNFTKKNYSPAKIVAYLSIISFFIIQVLKELWGRIRFNDLAGNFANFTAWYLPQGINGNHSFPSGHVMFAWLFLPAILFFINKKSIAKKYLIISFAILWGILVAIGRVIGGYHYASDVLFSSGIVITLFLILYKKYFTKN